MPELHKNRMLTKADLRVVRDMWETKTAREIAEQIGAKVSLVYAIAKKFRELGIKISFKRRKGFLDLLVKEVADEI